MVSIDDTTIRRYIKANAFLMLLYKSRHRLTEDEVHSLKRMALDGNIEGAHQLLYKLMQENG